ncbi:hypothetical protein GCM10009841_06980 [Microlunatus panaciterrae]|uniref:Tetratricopeptide (TPR) repeat protein n=1 Tax=Microlunatus panaciterrae TaxID=400768 RepID=A0ABS2RL57_9ACTN|nr:tetratricopeptide (TPR) repeat protein [Microlunatus panaciterrae]
MVTAADGSAVTATPSGIGPAFVGRSAAAAEIVRILAATRRSQGQLILLTGEAGAGKTRLAQHVLEQVTGLRVVWVPGRGPAAGDGYSVWSQVLLALTGREELARLVRAPSLLATVLSRGSGPAGPSTELPESMPAVPAGMADLEALQGRLYAELQRVLAAGSASEPLLLVLDDLEEADASSLELLVHLAAELPRMRVSVLAITDDKAPEWSHREGLLAGLFRHARTVPVGPLTAAEVAELAAPRTDPTVAAAIMERTGGHAFTVVELMGCLTGDSAVDLEIVGTSVPGSVRAVVAERVEGLPAAARRLVELAAVLGDIDVQVLAAVSRTDPLQVRAGLEQAGRAGLLEPGGGESWTFRHALVRDALLGLLDASERSDLHLRIGSELAVLIQRGRQIDPGTAARHLLLAGPAAAALALEQCRRAGERAMTLMAYAGAVEWFERALEVAASTGIGVAEQAELQIGLGEARIGAGHRESARTALLQAADLADRCDRPDLMARAALALGSGYTGFEVPILDQDQIELLRSCCAVLPRDSALWVQVAARLSVASTMLVDDLERLELAEGAVERARQLAEPAVLAYALSALSDARSGPDCCHQRLALGQEMLELAQRQHDRPLELLGRRFRLVALLELGSLGEAATEARAFRVVADALGQPLYGWYVPLWRAMRALAEGRLEDCRQAMAQTRALGAAADSSNALTLVLTQQWCLCAEQDDRVALAEMSREFNPEDFGGVWAYVTRALVSAQLGETDRARVELDAAVPLLRRAPRDSEWLPMMAQFAEVVAVLGPHPAAAPVYDELAPYADLFVVEGIGAALRGPVHRHLGLLAAVLGRRAAAEAHFLAAAEQTSAVGASLLLARIQRDAGLALGDAARLAEARELYRRLGLEARVAEIDAHGAGAPTPVAGPARRGATPSGAVFRREGESWRVGTGGSTSLLHDSKGLRDLALLLARPGRAIAALDLATATEGAPGTARAERSDGLSRSADTGEVLDAAARSAYRRRLEDLAEELAEADRSGDRERSSRLSAEQDALLEQLTAAYGLGGRVRRAGSDAERARTAVTARIKEAIRRVERVQPDLGRHLRHAVRTGTFCVYDPEERPDWAL